MGTIALIFDILGPLLAKCHSQVSAEDPREYLKAHHDPQMDTFDDGIVRDAMPQTYRAIRHAKRQTPRAERRDFPKYSRDDVRSMTIDKLKQSLNASDNEVAACQAAAASLPDSDE